MMQSPSQWDLPESVEQYGNFKTVWNVSLSEENFPTLGQASTKSPIPESVSSLPEISEDQTVLNQFDCVTPPFPLNAVNWDMFVGPRYEDRNGNVRLTCAALRAVKLYISRVSFLLKNGESKICEFKAMFVINTGVLEVQIQTTPGDTELIVSARAGLREFLGENSQKKELQHFYEMMDKSMVFDELAFHPFVQNSEGRLVFPIRCLLLLYGHDNFLYSQEATMGQPYFQGMEVAEPLMWHKSWDSEFNSWFRREYLNHPYTATFAQLAPFLGNDVESYRVVWNEDRARNLLDVATGLEPATSSSQPAQDKTKLPSSLVRFARALPTHVNDFQKDEDKLSEAEIESKFSRVFYYINLALFEFVLQRGIDLSSLENPRTLCQFGLKIKKLFNFAQARSYLPSLVIN